MNTMNAFLLSGLLASASISFAAPRVEEEETIESPDGLYRAVHLREFDDDGFVSHYFQTFPKGDPGHSRMVGPFSRNVEWSWSPDHKYAAVTWYVLSNETVTLVLVRDGDGRLRPVNGRADDDETAAENAGFDFSARFWEMFRAENGMKLQPDHSYVYALAWLDGRTLLLGSLGYESGQKESSDGWAALYDVERDTLSADWDAWQRSHGTLPPMRPVRSDSGQFDDEVADVVRQGEGYEVRATLQKDTGADPEPGSRAVLLRGEGDCSLRVAPEGLAMAVNTFKPGSRACVQLFVRKTTMQRFAEAMPDDALVRAFAENAGWKDADAGFVDMQAAGWLDASTVILQGTLSDAAGKIRADHTALYDAGKGRFLSGLKEFNRSGVERSEKR